MNTYELFCGLSLNSDGSDPQLDHELTFRARDLAEFDAFLAAAIEAARDMARDHFAAAAAIREERS